MSVNIVGGVDGISEGIDVGVKGLRVGSSVQLVSHCVGTGVGELEPPSDVGNISQRFNAEKVR